MKLRFLPCWPIGALLAALTCVQAQPVPRMSNGKPDLSGVWDHPRVGDMSKDVNGRCVGGTPGCSSIGAHDLNSLLTPFGKAENATAVARFATCT